jgi:hypothetical protein
MRPRSQHRRQASKPCRVSGHTVLHGPEHIRYDRVAILKTAIHKWRVRAESEDINQKVNVKGGHQQGNNAAAQSIGFEQHVTIGGTKGRAAGRGVTGEVQQLLLVGVCFDEHRL